jgi:hypothetical protein
VAIDLLLVVGDEVAERAHKWLVTCGALRGVCVTGAQKRVTVLGVVGKLCLGFEPTNRKC